MIVKNVGAARACAVCHRTLLTGERAWRYMPGGGDWVDVCALCTDEANGNGWIREGSPTTPLVSDGRGRRRRRLPNLGLLHAARPEPELAPSQPVLRRLSPAELAMLETAELFNESAYKRTVAGIAKSLGEPRVSLLALSGTNREVVVTVAWEISWYQYRVTVGASQPVRLADRGYELDELDDRFKAWNASLDEAGRVLPDIPRV
jgi:hypothetical protein